MGGSQAPAEHGDVVWDTRGWLQWPRRDSWEAGLEQGFRGRRRPWEWAVSPSWGSGLSPARCGKAVGQGQDRKVGAFHLELRSISPLTLLLVSLCYSQAAQALRPQTPVSWARGAGSSPVLPSTCGGDAGLTSMSGEARCLTFVRGSVLEPASLGPLSLINKFAGTFPGALRFSAYRPTPAEGDVSERVTLAPFQGSVLA